MYICINNLFSSTVGPTLCFTWC